MRKTILFLLTSPLLLATDYTFVDLNSPWHFGMEFDEKNKGLHWHVEGEALYVGEAKITTHGPFEGSKFTSATAIGSLYYSHFLNETNALSWQLAYNYFMFDWKENPRFSQRNFHYGLASMAWISHGMDDWRWVVSGGLTANLQMLDEFGRSAVGYGFIWGRYVYNLNVGLHAGLFGYGGANNGRALPILGVDFTLNKWKLFVIMPLDLSLEYHFSDRWFGSLAMSSLGGPYRFPWRFSGGKGRFENGIFEFYSRGLDLTINYNYETTFGARFGAGYNFGGWALIKDEHNRHGRYYKFDGAPYALGELAFTF